MGEDVVELQRRREGKINTAHDLGAGGDGEFEIGGGGKEVISSDSAAAPPKSLRLHHVLSHTLHGTITGLGAIKTIASREDGLSRLVVSYEEAKVSSTSPFFPPSLGPSSSPPSSSSSFCLYRWPSSNGAIRPTPSKPSLCTPTSELLRSYVLFFPSLSLSFPDLSLLPSPGPRRSHRLRSSPPSRPRLPMRHLAPSQQLHGRPTHPRRRSRRRRFRDRGRRKGQEVRIDASFPFFPLLSSMELGADILAFVYVVEKYPTLHPTPSTCQSWILESETSKISASSLVSTPQPSPSSTRLSSLGPSESNVVLVRAPFSLAHSPVSFPPFPLQAATPNATPSPSPSTLSTPILPTQPTL